MAYVRLIRKLALSMNGIDVSGLKVGDVIELDDGRAEMMIDLGWAEPCAGGNDATSSGAAGPSEPRRNHSTPK